VVGQKKEDHILGLGVLDNLPRPNAGTGINWTRLLVYLRSSSKPYIVIYSLPNSVLRKVRIFNRGKSLTRRGATWGVFFLLIMLTVGEKAMKIGSSRNHQGKKERKMSGR